MIYSPKQPRTKGPRHGTSLFVRQGSEESLSSTTSSIPLDEIPCKSVVVEHLGLSPQPHVKNESHPGRRVRFGDDLKVCITIPTPSSSELHERWYTEQDFKTFKRETKRLFKHLVLKSIENESYDSWTLCLERAYHGFILACDLHDVQRVKACNRAALTPLLVGMERWVLPGRREERHLLRLEILERIRNIQMKKLSIHVKTSRIGEICRELSRPSRLYAGFLAELSHSTQPTKRPLDQEALAE